MYRFGSRVRYSEIDENGILSLSSIINYMQDCSTFQSEDMGVGLEYLSKRGVVWLMNAWQIVINRRPGLGEYITAGTWAYGFKSMYGYRNFVIDDAKGEHLVMANSIWVYYDLKRCRPAKVDEEALRAYPIKEKLDMEYASRKIIVPETGCGMGSFPVRRYHLDTNRHVNNGQYIRMAQEFIPEDLQVVQIRAEYRKSAVMGDVFFPYAAKEGKRFVVSLNNETGEAFAVVEMTGV